ncbi:glycosyltransferase family 2 protein [Flavobacteriales bacterium]|nr:glycosyltransferase family 2 protein [Flavobacteriales bacterium]
MSQENLVSVIIPAYNAGPYIEETVHSVLQQTYTNFELIIVNDGSTDNTLEQLELLKEKHSMLQLITKTNSGVCDSRNMGFNGAKGEYITFLDADDTWDPSFLTNCISVLQNDENTVNAVYTEVELINEKSKKLDQFIAANTIWNASDVLSWKIGYVASMGSAVYRKSIVDKVGLFDNRLSTAADQDFHLRIAAETPIVAIAKVLFYYRIHANNMHQNIDVMEKDHLLVFQKAKLKNQFESNRFRRQCFSNLYKILAGSWWKEGNNKLKGIKFVIKSILIYPPIVKKYLS